VAFCLPQQVVRRSGRIPREIPILLIGSDLGGKIFSELTKTVLLSLHGAGLISTHKLSPEQEMVLRWPERNKEAEIRVVGQIGADSGAYPYGVAFFDHVVNFWEMEFPPPSPREQEFGHLTLVCNVCQTLERIDDSSIEADVVATNDGVLRFCKRCGCSTIWKLGQPGAPAPIPARPTPPPPVPQPGPVIAPAYSAAHESQKPVASAYTAAPPADFVAGGLPAVASAKLLYFFAAARATFQTRSSFFAFTTYFRTYFACGHRKISRKARRSWRQSAQACPHQSELHRSGPPRRARRRIRSMRGRLAFALQEHQQIS
jgi:hypothetical protein